MEELWSIVEFEDGMEMIPTSWIMEDKSAARWPNFTSLSFEIYKSCKEPHII